MKLDFTNERVLAVTAHPDDAELHCAGTLARAKQDGAEVAICVMCGGDKGQSARPVANLAQVRRREMAAAAKLLGAELFACGYGDGTLRDGLRPRRRLLEIYRLFRPTLVLAHFPGDYHPDHRAAAALAEAVSWFCASKGHRSRAPIMEQPPSLWWMDTIDMLGFEPGFWVEVTDGIELKERMLRCHQSQLRRAQDPDFTSLLKLMRRQYRLRGAQAGVPAAEAFCLHQVFKRCRAW